MSEGDKDDPVVWLLLLERGRQTGDFELATRAQKELERLGITVTYHRARHRDKDIPSVQQS
jgi:hypothetical protein